MSKIYILFFPVNKTDPLQNLRKKEEVLDVSHSKVCTNNFSN